MRHALHYPGNDVGWKWVSVEHTGMRLTSLLAATTVMLAGTGFAQELDDMSWLKVSSALQSQENQRQENARTMENIRQESVARMDKMRQEAKEQAEKQEAKREQEAKEAKEEQQAVMRSAQEYNERAARLGEHPIIIRSTTTPTPAAIVQTTPDNLVATPEEIARNSAKDIADEQKRQQALEKAVRDEIKARH